MVSSGRNSSRIRTGMSPGTLHVFFPLANPSWTMWSAKYGWLQTSLSSLVLTKLGSVSVFRGEYSWLMAQKNSHILLDDSRAVRLSSTCWGRENDDWCWSPGRAARSLTCLSQLLFLAETFSDYFLRNSTVASLILFLTSFFNCLYLKIFKIMTFLFVF